MNHFNYIPTTESTEFELLESQSQTETMSMVTDEANAMDNLYPALIQCFAVILCGYVLNIKIKPVL